MRILIVTQYYWPEVFRINDLTEEFVRRGHQVTVLTGVPNYPDGSVFSEYADNPNAYKTYKGVDIVRVPIVVRGKGDFQLFLNYLTFIISSTVIGLFKLRKQSFDSIFVFQPSPITVGLPAIAFRYFKKSPLVFWVLDLWPDTLEAVGVVRSKIILSVIGRLVSFIYNHCDLLLGQSKSFLPHIQKNSKNRRIEYFPSWADSAIQQVQKNTNSSMKSGDNFNVMFTGNVGDSQDFPAILNAVDLLKENNSIHWTIVGDGRISGWLKKEIKKRGLEGVMTLAGRHPVEKMPEFFKQADALLVSLKDKPVYEMTIPGKLQAYLMSGKPILAMLSGEGANIVAESGCGITCTAGNWKCLADAVQKLYSMPETELVSMGEKGIDFSMKEFNREHLISKLENWLLELSKKKRAFE